jgi:hypothetical protein
MSMNSVTSTDTQVLIHINWTPDQVRSDGAGSVTIVLKL